MHVQMAWIEKDVVVFQCLERELGENIEGSGERTGNQKLEKSFRGSLQENER